MGSGFTAASDGWQPGIGDTPSVPLRGSRGLGQSTSLHHAGSISAASSRKHAAATAQDSHYAKDAITRARAIVGLEIDPNMAHSTVSDSVINSTPGKRTHSMPVIRSNQGLEQVGAHRPART